MNEFSLYVLDITMNSVRAGATEIEVKLEEKGNMLFFSVTDNGCGMKHEMVERLCDPFFTTRTTRSVGLGIPFLTMLSEQTGGSVEITSKHEEEYPEDHGTVISASFTMDHIDFIPLGDMVGTVTTLIQGSPDIDFTYIHIMSGGTVRLSCRELRDMLGDEISLASFEVLEWIKGYLEEAYESLK